MVTVSHSLHRLTSDPRLPVCPAELRLLVRVLDQMLRSSPSELLSIHEQQQRSRLRQEVDGVRLKLEETLMWSQQEKVRRREEPIAEERAPEVLQEVQSCSSS